MCLSGGEGAGPGQELAFAQVSQLQKRQTDQKNMPPSGLQQRGNPAPLGGHSSGPQRTTGRVAGFQPHGPGALGVHSSR